MSILKVYDNNGRKVNIPAIKGEPGVACYRKSNEKIYDETMRFDDTTQISVGSVKVAGTSVSEICDYGNGLHLMKCTLEFLEEYSDDSPLFSKVFDTVNSKIVQFNTTFDDMYTIVNTFADTTENSFDNMYALYISENTETAPNGELNYSVTGRWDC